MKYLLLTAFQFMLPVSFATEWRDSAAIKYRSFFKVRKKPPISFAGDLLCGN